MFRCSLKWFSLLGLLALDFATKIGALEMVPPLAPYGRGYPFGGIGMFDCSGITFSLNTVVNTGAACGLFPGYPGLLFGVRLAIIAGLIAYLCFERRSQKSLWPLWVVVTGALGNVVDYCLYGHVIDFLHFTFWGKSFPIFNFADSYITLGVIYFVLRDSLKKKVQPV